MEPDSQMPVFFVVLQDIATASPDKSIVTIANHLPRPTFEHGMWLDYAGIPLEQLDMCGRRGQQLAAMANVTFGARR